MKIPEIHEIEIPVQGKGSRKVGLRLEDRSVYIYFVGERDMAGDTSDGRLSDIFRLTEAVQNVHALCFHKAPIDSLNWHVRSGHAVSDVVFSTGKNGEIEKINVSNMAAYHQPFFAPLSDYQQDKFGEFNPVLTLKMEYKKPAEVFVQKHPNGKSYFFEHHTNSSPENQAVVFVNAKQLMALIQACSPEQYMPTEQAKMGWDIERTTSEHGAYSLSNFSCFRLNDGKLIFGINSGWADHVMALCHSGMECFPVAVDKEQAPLLNQLCGAHQNKWQDPKKPNNNPRP